MKKIIIVLLVLMVLFVSGGSNEEVIIPKDAIRFRVIANSNNDIDQKNKKKVVANLTREITYVLSKSNNINDSRLLIKKNMQNFKENIDNTIKVNNINQNYKIRYGYNNFPEKKYKGVKYKEGKYESLVVTLGKGKGKNFWCVLFPPLCLLEKEEKELDNINYSSLVKETIDKYF